MGPKAPKSPKSIGSPLYKKNVDKKAPPFGVHLEQKGGFLNWNTPDAWMSPFIAHQREVRRCTSKIAQWIATLGYHNLYW